MGISASLIWQSYIEALDVQTKRKIKTALMFYVVQLIFNIILFSFSNNPVITILFLFFATLTFIKFRQINKSASLMFVPYLLWVGLINIISLTIWQREILPRLDWSGKNLK